MQVEPGTTYNPLLPQVYLRIKAAMDLAEEARLERDAATSTTAALRHQLEATQVCREHLCGAGLQRNQLLRAVLFQHHLGGSFCSGQTLHVPVTQRVDCF